MSDNEQKKRKPHDEWSDIWQQEKKVEDVRMCCGDDWFAGDRNETGTKSRDNENMSFIGFNTTPPLLMMGDEVANSDSSCVEWSNITSNNSKDKKEHEERKRGIINEERNDQCECSCDDEKQQQRKGLWSDVDDIKKKTNSKNEGGFKERQEPYQSTAIIEERQQQKQETARKSRIYQGVDVDKLMSYVKNQDPRSDGRYECIMCNTSFCHRTHLKRHMIVHTQPPPFSCKFVEQNGLVCGRGFYRKDHFRYHMNQHTNSRPFKCTHAGCHSAFRQKGALTRHCKKLHQKARCSNCKKQFASNSKLAQHRRKTCKHTAPNHNNTITDTTTLQEGKTLRTKTSSPTPPASSIIPSIFTPPNNNKTNVMMMMVELEGVNSFINKNNNNNTHHLDDNVASQLQPQQQLTIPENGSLMAQQPQQLHQPQPFLQQHHQQQGTTDSNMSSNFVFDTALLCSKENSEVIVNLLLSLLRSNPPTCIEILANFHRTQNYEMINAINENMKERISQLQHHHPSHS
eukprot:m.36437 g.36437  ORF g.36437 m.36437 type:complete len:515 (-) comp10091_c0_seq1:1366-2910(-)